MSTLAELTAIAIKQQSTMVKPVVNASGVTTVTPTPWGPYPTGRLPFDQVGTVNLPAVGAGDTTVLTFQVPLGYDGVTQYYSLNFMGGGFTEGSGDIVWRILQNGATVRNFENITSERGTVYIPRPVANLQFFSNDIITVVVNHIANAALIGQVIVSLNGYYYPIQS